MLNRKPAFALVLSVFCATAPVHAQSNPNARTSAQLIEAGFPNVATVSPANAAGLLSYCVKNKHLAAPRAEPVLSGLMKRPGLATSSGYQLGQSGHIISASRRAMTFAEIPQASKGQACEAVLKRGSSVPAQKPSTASAPNAAKKSKY